MSLRHRYSPRCALVRKFRAALSLFRFGAVRLFSTSEAARAVATLPGTSLSVFFDRRFFVYRPVGGLRFVVVFKFFN